MEKEEARKNRRLNYFVAFVSIGITIASVGGYKFIFPEPERAEVQQIDGIYVYLLSKPTLEYESLGVESLSSIDRAVNSAKGENKFGGILKTIGQSLFNDVSFENRLRSIISKVRSKNPNVEGVIFMKDLTECEAIKF